MPGYGRLGNIKIVQGAGRRRLYILTRFDIEKSGDGVLGKCSRQERFAYSESCEGLRTQIGRTTQHLIEIRRWHYLTEVIVRLSLPIEDCKHANGGIISQTMSACSKPAFTTDDGPQGNHSSRHMPRHIKHKHKLSGLDSSLNAVAHRVPGTHSATSIGDLLVLFTSRVLLFWQALLHLFV